MSDSVPPPPPPPPPSPPSPPPPPGFPPPGFPPPSGSGSPVPAASGTQPAWWKRKAAKLPVWAWLLIVVVIAGGGIGAALGGGGDDDTAVPAAPPTNSATDEPRPTGAPDTEPDPSDTPPTVADDSTTSIDDVTTTEAAPDTTAAASDPDAVTGAPPGVVGTRDQPVAPGQIADIGGGWRLQVLDVVADGTQMVADENEFNEPPPPGSAFTFVTVALGYFGLEDPRVGLETTISAVGAGNTELSSDCGLIPAELDGFTYIFSGGVVVGNVCFVTNPGDVEVLQLYAVGDAFSDNPEVFLTAAAPATPATPMAGLIGPQDGAASTSARRSPTPVATPADLGEGWTLSVDGPATDITDAVAAENQFNEPPPDGSRFVGMQVTYAYNGTEVAQPFSVIVNAVGDSNLQLSGNCGVVPGQLDTFSDVLPGGSVSGTLCFVVPEADLGSVVLYASADVFAENKIMFATA